MTETTILSVSDLSVVYRQQHGLFTGKGRTFHALDDIELNLPRGSILAVVGESGSGKTTLAKCLAGLITPSSGKITHSKRIQFVFQDPYASLNPGMTIEQLIQEPLDYLSPPLSKTTRQQRTVKIFEQVGLDFEQRHRYPHELSGGQCQRVAIARAVIARPDILISDEPVSALDVSVRAQVINLLAMLNKTLALSQIFISHDLWLTRKFTDQMLVLYRGRVVESGPTQTIFSRPAHPYTQALIDAIPVPDPQAERQRKKRSITAANLPPAASGCRYAERCERASQRCFTEIPPLAKRQSGVSVACFYPMDE